MKSIEREQVLEYFSSLHEGDRVNPQKFLKILPVNIYSVYTLLKKMECIDNYNQIKTKLNCDICHFNGSDPNIRTNCPNSSVKYLE